MKKTFRQYIALLLLLVPMSLLTGCRVGVMTHTSGMNDQGYIEVVCTNAHKPVIVFIDQNTRFEAKVTKETKRNVKGNKYTVAPGKRHLVVQDDKGQVLYDRTVMIYAQQSKIIRINK
ncbi:MAG TPA: hypothetical protein PLK40_04220 [Bacteroidaceae bacterium]|nr:hypothetical protein [Bacteroidaceae bacterium]